MSGHTYSVYGLTVWSDTEFPYLAPASGTADVRIHIGDVPHDHPDDYGNSSKDFSSSFLLTVDDVARYLISSGNDICIEPLPGADAGAIRLFLFGSAFGALLHQRGLLPLHGSAVLTPRGAAVFTGASGSGKSTLACALHQRGYPILTDDVCVIASDEIPTVVPGNPYLMLWADALQELEIDSSLLQPVLPRIQKYVLPLNPGFGRSSVALRAIYALSPEDSATPALTPVTGLRKFETLAQNLYRPGFVEQLGVQSVQLRRVVEVARHTPVTIVHRPVASFQPKLVADLIEHDLFS